MLTKENDLYTCVSGGKWIKLNDFEENGDFEKSVFKHEKTSRIKILEKIVKSVTLTMDSEVTLPTLNTSEENVEADLCEFLIKFFRKESPQNKSPEDLRAVFDFDIDNL